MTVEALIDKAAEKVGNRYRLAKLLGCTVSQVYDWRAGTKRCHAPDRARLAAIIGDDAVQELVRATLEETAGTTRGEQLFRVMGKWSRQTGEAALSVMLVVSSLTFGMMMIDIPRCILC